MKKVASRPENKKEVLELWQKIFQDTDQYVNLFFDRVYKKENTLVIRDNGSIISALQMIPYEIKTGDRIVSAAYVCGVCTHPSKQGKGYMRQLMSEAMDEMRQRKYAITILIPAEPWLFDFYKKFGYVTPINYMLETYSHKKTEHTAPGNYTFKPCSKAGFSYFDKKQHERQCAILHDKYDFETIIRENTYGKGKVWLAMEHDEIVGMAFVLPTSQNSILLKEILYDKLPVKEALIDHAIKHYSVQTAKVRNPVSCEITGAVHQQSPVYPYGVACVFDKTLPDISGIYMTLMLD